MPDFRVQDYRAEDHRLREVGLVAAGLWAQAGAVAMRDGTDGWVPLHYVRSWRGGLSAARKLVEIGLWTHHRLGTRDGFLFAQDEWNREQRLAREVEEDREKARARAQRSRRARRDRDLAASGQLTTGPVAVPPPPPDPPDEDPVTRDVTRDTDRTSREHVTGGVTPHVTPERHGERTLLPPPPPLPVGGSGEEERYGSERDVHARPPARPALTRSGTTYPQARLTDVVDISVLSIDQLDALDPRCSLHRQDPPDAKVPVCTPCGIRRRAIASARARLVDSDLASRRGLRDRRAAAIAACPDCDEAAWLLGTDGTPVHPARRCEHPRLALVEHQATGTGGEQ